MNTGDRIKQRRIELGLSADELATRIGKSRATIYRYENGDIENMPTPILEPLAKALETTPAQLMGWELSAEDIGNVFYSNMTQGVIKQMRATFSDQAVSHFETYNELNHQNKNLVDSYTEKLLSIQQMDDNLYELNAAHERTDIEVTDEMRKHDDDIMDDDNF